MNIALSSQSVLASAKIRELCGHRVRATADNIFDSYNPKSLTPEIAQSISFLICRLLLYFEARGERSRTALLLVSFDRELSFSL